MKLFPKELDSIKRAKVEPLTIRGIGSGGWNAVHDDVSMRQNYCVQLINSRRTPAGGQKLRYGTKWLVDTAGLLAGSIVDMTYFIAELIVGTEGGELGIVGPGGGAAAIWNSSIAALLPGGPSGWSGGLTTLDFVPFRNQLIVHNGVDKPIIIDRNYTATYLQDPVSGSNVNVPIGKYGCVVSNFHCVAGITNFPTTIYISSQGTSATFPGDPAPNNAISIDVGAYAPEGATEITGIKGFRKFLIVFFHEQSIVITLGQFDANGTHVPQFPDTFPKFGLLGHRCTVQLENDIQFASRRGWNSAKRNLFTTDLVDTKQLSDIVEPEYKNTVGKLTADQQMIDCFAVNDPLSHDTLITTADGRTFVYSANDELHYKAWSEFSGLGWRSACTTVQGRVFASIGTRIFQYGNGVFAGENYQADRIDDRDAVWNPGTNYNVGDLIRDTVTNETYKCILQHTSGLIDFATDRTITTQRWELYTGEDISLILEMPWLDSKDPMKTKQLSFLSLATKGTAEFTVQLYVDNLYKDENGSVVFDPAVEMTFTGNDTPGFGFDPGPYGGGRRSNHPGLYGLPVKFKTVKPRIICTAKKPLEIINMTFLFKRLSYRR